MSLFKKILEGLDQENEDGKLKKRHHRFLVALSGSPSSLLD